MTIRISMTMFAALALLACQTAKEPGPEPKPEPAPVLRKVMLTDDTRISIRVDDQDRVELTITVPAGNPHAGTYRTTSKYLLDDFKDSQKNQGQPGHAAWIMVNEKNEIQSMTNQATAQ